MRSGLRAALSHLAVRPRRTMSALVLLGAVLTGAALAGALLVNLIAVGRVLERQAGVIVTLADDAAPGRLAELTTELRRVSGVGQVRALPRYVGLAELRVALGDDADLLDDLGPEVVPDSLEVLPAGGEAAQGAALSELVAVIQALPDVAHVSRQGLANPSMRRLDAALVLLSGVGWAAFVLALVLASGVAAALTARVASERGDDIELLRLLGSSEARIRAPFVWAGALLGLGGGLLATAGLLALVAALSSALGPHAAVLGVEVLAPSAVSLLGLVGLGALSGALGAYVGAAPGGRS